MKTVVTINFSHLSDEEAKAAWNLIRRILGYRHK